MGLHQIKSFCRAKEAINKMKRQPMEWEKMFVNHASDKKLSKMCKEHLKLKSNSNHTKKSLLKNMGNGPEYTFLKRKHTSGQKVY